MLDVVEPPARRVAGAPPFALLLHAAVTATSPTNATRPQRRAARATLLSGSPPVRQLEMFW
jgi:hypothetical protein